MRIIADTPEKKIIVVSNPTAAAQFAAELFVERSRAAIQERGIFTAALSGGSTPKALYRLLATGPQFAGQIAWDKIHLFWGDERFVPHDHADSNFRMVKEQMLDWVPIPAANVHAVDTAISDPEACAADYGRKLRAFFGEHHLLSSCGGPAFDLNFLGLGADGHTASLFPESKALTETHHWCAANWVEKFKSWRITLTYPAINSARVIAFLAVGPDKSDRVTEILGADSTAHHYPAQFVRPSSGGQLLWILDEASAAGL